MTRSIAPFVVRQGLLLLLATPAPAGGQGVAADASPRFLLISGQSRWLNGGQPAAFSRMTQTYPEVLRIDSTQDTPTGARVFLSPRYPTLGSFSTSRTVVTRARSGRVTDILSAAVRFRSNLCGPIPPLTDPQEIALSEQQEVDSTWAMRVLAPFFERSPVARGPDRRPISFSVAKGLNQSQLRGTRVSRIVGDTTIRGRHYRIVRDSAWASVREVRSRLESHLDWHRFDSIPEVTRVVSGAVVGRRLVDAATGQTLRLSDTTVLRGIATLRLADGRSFATPTRFDQVWEVSRLDGDAATAGNRAVYAGWRVAEKPGVADAATARRIADHDPAVRDSLLRLFRVSRRVTQRDSVLNLLRIDYDFAWDDMLRAMLEAGDTTGFLRNIIRDGWATPERYQLLRPVLADPGYAFGHGIDPNTWLRPFLQAALNNPPAIVPDSTRWPCKPALCRTLAAEWPGAQDPQLRETGLIVRFVLDPARWADTIIALSRAGHRFLDDAANLAIGVGVAVYGGAASTGTIPPAGSPWQAWSRWMTGIPLSKADTFPILVDFQGPHRVAVEMNHLITGREFAGEFARQFRSATNDTARFVFGSMLDAISPDYRSNAEVAAAFATGGPLDRDLASEQVWRRFSEHPADSVTVSEIAGRLIAMLFRGAEPWPAMPGLPPGMLAAIRPDTLPPPTPRYVAADSLPRWVRDSAVAAGYIPRPYDWHPPDTATSVTAILRPVKQRGPLTTVELHRATVLPAPNGSFTGHEESWVIWLYHGERGWEQYHPVDGILHFPAVCIEG